MIDVVFLLLIDFMVTTDYVATEEVYQLDLPERAGAGAPEDPFRLDPDPLRVLVRSTGPESEQYTVQLVGPWPQPETFDALHSFLRSSLVVQAGSGLFPAEHPILIEPDAETAWEHAVEAFSSAVRAGYRNVQFVPTP